MISSRRVPSLLLRATSCLRPELFTLGGLGLRHTAGLGSRGSSFLASVPHRCLATASQGGAGEKKKMKGAHYNKKTGKWTSSITVSGTRIHLGTFDTEEEAGQAYAAAKSLYQGQLKQEKTRKPAAKAAEGKQYLGVYKVKGNAYEAVVTVNGNEISGGIYDTAEEAAHAYDAMARMYFGAETAVNFEVDPYSAWHPPEEQSKGPSTSIPVIEK